MRAASTPLTRLELKQRRADRKRRMLAWMLTPVLALGGVGAGIWGATTAVADPLPAPQVTVSIAETGPEGGNAFILAGEAATLDVSMRNLAAADGYNIAFTVLVPNGVAFQSSPMGAPVVYASGEELPNSAKDAGALNSVPAGFQLWVFEDVADLPEGASYASTIQVLPDAGRFPVGADPEITVTGYVSSQPGTLPIFDGSTGVGGTVAAGDTSGTATDRELDIRALRLTKSEPSPERELLRGVHDNHTVYTLTVENTPQGATGGVVLVDYLPAGLEFLGCATVDNSADVEYPGAGDITGTAPADCLTPVTVETVDSDLPAGLPEGVYTKVTWDLSTLSGVTPQNFGANAPGVPGTTTITYAAAVPLFENTMDFGGAEPTPGSLEQASNLNNNNGASTRQGQGAGFGDGIEYRNFASVTGQYQGAVAPGTPAAASDEAEESIIAMDLRILKDVDTGNADNTFRTGELATFTLNLATSEYVTADEITITDSLPNGLCPIFPAALVSDQMSGDPFPSDCGVADSDAVLVGATVTNVHYEAATGSFTVIFEPTVDSIPATPGEHVITYSALMRGSYIEAAPYTGNTSSGDAMTNTVDMEGWTHAIDALDGIEGAEGSQDVGDDSAATIESDYSETSKQVLPRNLVQTGPDAGETAAATCAVTDGWLDTATADTDIPFHLGDSVCFRLTVDFADDIDVRNPIVTDFLPAGIEYVDAVHVSGPELGAVTKNGNRIDLFPGSTVGADRFVTRGSTLVVHVLGTVTSMTPNQDETLDKPENLMKYRQHNVHGEVFYERDAAGILTGQSPTLLKGVRDVEDEATRTAATQGLADGTEFDSNRDGISVVQGEDVTYRIDLTRGTADVADMHVWDRLPEGVTATDVSGAQLDGAAEIPTFEVIDGRTYIKWSGIDLTTANPRRTLTYTVTIPEGVAINTTLPNTASITQFDVVLNTGGTKTFYPEGSLDTTQRGDHETTPGTRSRDDSAVHTPIATVAKERRSTEISTGDLRNLDNHAVQGELITYEYSVTIPAHTTVRGAVLQDRGTLTPGNVAFTATAGEWEATNITGATLGDFSFAHAPASGTERGVLTFPAVYTNSSDDPQTFTVTLTGYVGDAGNNNITLTNQAQFRSDTWNGNATATVVYREPAPVITKTADETERLAIGDEVTYTLEVTNVDRVISYDNTIVDTVPAGLVVEPGTFTINGATVSDSALTVESGVFAGDGGTITWRSSNDASSPLNALAEIPSTVELTYVATIGEGTGAGLTYTNTATVTGYTLPSTLTNDPGDRRGERTSTTTEDVTAIDAGLVKGVRVADSGDAFTESTTAPIGDRVEYQVDITLHGNINYYDPQIVDRLPAGAELVASSVEFTLLDEDGDPLADLSGVWDFNAASHTWAYDGDIEDVPYQRTLRLTYLVDLTNTIAVTTNQVDNTATFTWNTINDEPDSEDSTSDEARVDVPNPYLQIVKKVDGEDAITRNPGDTFDYTLTVSQSSLGTTPAFDITVEDVVPAGIIVSDVSHGGVADAGALAGAGGTITWILDGPLHHQLSTGTPKAIDLTYQGEFVESEDLEAIAYENIVDVTRYTSFEEGGRAYVPGTTPGYPRVTDEAEVTPLFPYVELDKAVTIPVDGEEYGLAYVGQPFSWTLTLVNTGEGVAQTIDVSDVLPKNWEYTAMTSVTVGGTALPTAPTPTVTTDDGRQTLTWNLGSAAPTAALLPGDDGIASEADRTIVIVFTATPQEGAIDDAGTGVEVNAHVNTLSAATTDPTGAEENGVGPYTGDPDDATAYIAEADLQLHKSAIGGVVETGDNLYGLDAGTWISGQAPVSSSYAQPQWQLVVTNHGPDAASGPFEIIDLPVLPAGVTMGDWSARYFANASDTTGNGLAISGSGTEADPFQVGDSTTSLKADGSDRIVLVADVHIAANATATGAQLSNVASVEGATFERDSKKPDDGTNPHPNTDAAERPLTQVADLAIDKVLNTAQPNAGMPITWQLNVTNLGPSDSYSSADTPITLTDTVPAGVTGVTASDGGGQWVPTADGHPIPSTGVGAGAEIVWTYQGSVLARGATASVTLTGTIDAGWTGGTITNAATVTPGETEDPNEPNNTDEVPANPTDDTSLAIAKTRVVLDGGVWRDATDDDEFAPGEQISYRVDVANNGPAVARNVTVVDEVPTGLTYTTHASTSGTWARTAGGANADGTTNAAWDTFALGAAQPVGATRSFVVTYDTDPALDPDEGVENSAEASADNSTNDPRDSDDTTSSRRADLSIVKSHTAPAVDEAAVAGGSVDYRLVVTNHGPSDATAEVDVTDTLPVGFSYRAGSARVAVDGGAAASDDPEVSGQTLTWANLTGGADLPFGATIVITFTADIAADVRAQVGVLNVATVDSPEDTDPSNNSSNDPVDIETRAAMTVIKKVSDDGDWADDATKVAGTDVTYQLTIVNEGPSEVPASITDTLPAGLTLVSMAGTDWECDVTPGAQTGTCDYDDLHPVGTTTITVVAHLASGVEAGTELENEIVLTWTDSDGDHTDDDKAKVTATNVSDLGVKKAVRPVAGSDEWIDAQHADAAGTVIAGADTEYRLLVSNEGPSDAVAPLAVIDALPVGATFGELVGSSGWTAVYDDVAGTVTFTRDADLGGLAFGADPLEIVYTVAFDAALEAGAILTNTAELTDDALDANNDGNPDNHSDPAVVEVERLVDLSIVKTHADSDVRIGDELAFDLTVRNVGPSQATEIVVTDTLPAGLEYVSAGESDAGWTVVADEPAEDGTTRVVATLDEPLAVGETAPALQVVVLVHPGAYAEVVNVADVEAAEPEENLEDNTTEDPVTVPPMSTLIVAKEAVGDFQVGSQGNYRITVRNDGPTEDPGPVTITDVLPEGLRFISAQADGAECVQDGQVVTCVLTEPLGVSEQQTIELRVSVEKAAYPQVVNTAIVETPTEQTPDGVPSDTVTTPVKEDPLARTGADVPLLLLAVGIPLLAAGAYLLLVRRRRQDA